MTRKGLFDSILQGCIPVVFDVLTASVMYTWHWEEDFWKQVVIEFPLHAVSHRYFDPVEALLNMYRNHTETIITKQKLIRSRVFSLQYGLDGLEDLYQYKSALPYLKLINTNISDTNNITYQHKHSSIDTNHVELDSNLNSSWPRRDAATVTSNGEEGHQYMRDAYDIVVDYFLGWHSGQIPHIRNATVPECWDGWLDKVLNKCRPGQEPALKV